MTMLDGDLLFYLSLSDFLLNIWLENTYSPQNWGIYHQMGCTINRTHKKHILARVIVVRAIRCEKLL